MSLLETSSFYILLVLARAKRAQVLVHVHLAHSVQIEMKSVTSVIYMEQYSILWLIETLTVVFCLSHVEAVTQRRDCKQYKTIPTSAHVGEGN